MGLEVVGDALIIIDSSVLVTFPKSLLKH